MKRLNRCLFWFLSALTIVFLALQVLGYPVFPVFPASQQFKTDLDKIAEKAIENKLHDLSRTMAAGIGSLDDRILIMEEKRLKGHLNKL